MAAKYSSSSESYPQITLQVLVEMNRQVGVARLDADGLMRRGLMIRHLVMPNGIGGTRQVVEQIAENLPKDTYFNIMSQYTPMNKAFEHPEINRREYSEAVRWVEEAGLTNLDIQGPPLSSGGGRTFLREAQHLGLFRVILKTQVIHRLRLSAQHSPLWRRHSSSGAPSV